LGHHVPQGLLQQQQQQQQRTPPMGSTTEWSSPQPLRANGSGNAGTPGGSRPSSVAGGMSRSFNNGSVMPSSPLEGVNQPMYGSPPANGYPLNGAVPRQR
jgi:hypothetical protein